MLRFYINTFTMTNAEVLHLFIGSLLGRYNLQTFLLIGLKIYKSYTISFYSRKRNFSQIESFSNLKQFL